MVNKNSIKLFGDDKIRAIWDDEQEKWYFSVVDVVAVLTNSPNPQTYWRVLKKRLKDEGNGGRVKTPNINKKTRCTFLCGCTTSFCFSTKKSLINILYGVIWVK